MLLHRIKTIMAYIRGLIFCIYAWLFCKSFTSNGIPRCYGWPELRAADGSLHLGKDVRLGRIKIIISEGGKIRIGDRVGINDGCIIGSLLSITIGSETSIAENVMIRDHDHDYKDIAIGQKPKHYISKEIWLGNGCWIGYGCVITKGVNIRDGAIVGASTVVTKDISTGNVVVGTPNRIISSRLTPK